MIHTFRVAKTAFSLIVSTILVALVAGLIYLNQVGFPGTYGESLRQELANRGLHLTFESLRFDLRKGFVATNVSFYPSEENRTPLLEAKEICLDLDKTKALRGNFELRNIHVTHGTARIPVDENGRMVTAHDINGALIITESGRATVQETTGLIEGIRVTLSADLKLVKEVGEELPQDQQDALQSNHVLSLVLDELALWSIPPETPPELTFKIKGDLQHPDRLTTDFTLKAINLDRNNYHLDQLNLSGDLQSQLVTLDHILLQDASGTASGQGDWSVSRREGRFDVISDLNLQSFLQNCFGITVLKNLTLDTPPTLKLNGTFAAPESQKFSVKATGHGTIGKFKFVDTPFLGLTSEFSWHDGDLYLRDFEVKHQKGQANGSLLLEDSLARYDVRSTLPLEAFRPFIKPGQQLDKIIAGLKFADNSIVALDVVGTSDRTDLTSWSAIGKAHLTDFIYRGVPFLGLTSKFSWHHGELSLRDIEVKHQKGQANGSLLLEDSLARYDVRSTLPLEAFRPFIKPGRQLDKIIAGLEFADNSILALDVIGTSDRTDLTSWTAIGKAHFTNFTYRGTRCHHLACSYNLIPGQVEFSNLTALLNDDEEPARLLHRSAPSKELYADRILYNPNTKLTTISNLRGKVWPTPIIRIFAPDIAQYLEKEYRFHQTPHLVLNGTFAGPQQDHDQTLFSVAARTEGQTDYPFLGKDLPLQNLTANLVVRGCGITAKNLSATTLGGTISGAVFADVTPGQKTTYQGALKWDELSFPLISQTYEFDEEEKGTLTGSIDFNGNADGIRAFNADGLIAITKGHLVSIPILGPLSPLISGILGKERLGHERAKDASSTFTILNGVAQTKDFIALSTNITLTGEGWVDLNTDRLDMTVRVNARGLLGLLTLPLKPLKGIFQFRGTGIYTDPKWRSSPFTRPTKGKADPIFQKPGKAFIIPE